VSALKTIETKVAQIIATFGPSATEAARNAVEDVGTDADLLNGPQLPAHALDQSDIDRLMASFE